VFKDKWTKDFDIKNFIIQITANQGSKNTGGMWTRPDITLIGVNSFAYYPVKTMDVITFEIKHFSDLSIAGVFETAAQSKFANKSYLIIYYPAEAQNTFSEIDLARLKTECERFSVGLIYFTDPTDYDSFNFVVEAERLIPDPANQDEFINKQINDENKKILLEYLR